MANKWERVDISKISVNWGVGGGANRLKWTEKIENLVIDPPTIRKGRVLILKKIKNANNKKFTKF